MQSRGGIVYKGYFSIGIGYDHAFRQLTQDRGVFRCIGFGPDARLIEQTLAPDTLGNVASDSVQSQRVARRIANEARIDFPNHTPARAVEHFDLISSSVALACELRGQHRLVSFPGFGRSEIGNAMADQSVP